MLYIRAVFFITPFKLKVALFLKALVGNSHRSFNHVVFILVHYHDIGKRIKCFGFRATMSVRNLARQAAVLIS